MSRAIQYVNGLLNTYQERRALPRTQIELPVHLLVVRRTRANTDPVLLSGVIHDVSAGGAMLSTSESIPTTRVWLHFDDFPGPNYLEANVVRQAQPQIPMGYSYGVEFSRMMASEQFAQFIGHHTRNQTLTSPSPLPPQNAGDCRRRSDPDRLTAASAGLSVERNSGIMISMQR